MVLADPSARRSLARNTSLCFAHEGFDRSPVSKKIAPDDNGARWMNADGPAGEPIRMVEVIDTPDHRKDGPRYSILVAGPIDWLESRLANFSTRLSIALALAGIGLVTVTLFQVRFGLLPLRRIERGLSDIRSGKASNLEGELRSRLSLSRSSSTHSSPRIRKSSIAPAPRSAILRMR